MAQDSSAPLCGCQLCSGDQGTFHVGLKDLGIKSVSFCRRGKKWRYSLGLYWQKVAT